MYLSKNACSVYLRLGRQLACFSLCTCLYLFMDLTISLEGCLKSWEQLKILICVCICLCACCRETKKDGDRHLCSCVWNYEEVNVQPTIDFGKGSRWDDEEVCPVKWLLCEISCRRQIRHSLYSLLPVLQNSLGCIGCTQLHSYFLLTKTHQCLIMICWCIYHDHFSWKQNHINCFETCFSLSSLKKAWLSQW